MLVILKSNIYNLKDYGPDAQKPDMNYREYEVQKNDILNLLKTRQADRIKIEQETRGQSSSPSWHELRANLLTASNFGRICRMRKDTNTANCIDSLLYKVDFVKSPALQWGIEKESVAKEKLQEIKKWDIRDCGLFVHKVYFFLGASPDGLIGEDGVVEIKCPFSIMDMDPDDAIKEGKLKYFKIDGTLNYCHPYYYQIQGQLEVADKQYCEFVIWTPVNFIVRRIVRDKKFWKEKMEGILEKFFYNCFLPELVDPRKCRNMPLRSITLGSIQ